MINKLVSRLHCDNYVFVEPVLFYLQAEVASQLRISFIDKALISFNNELAMIFIRRTDRQGFVPSPFAIFSVIGSIQTNDSVVLVARAFTFAGRTNKILQIRIRDPSCSGTEHIFRLTLTEESFICKRNCWVAACTFVEIGIEQAILAIVHEAGFTIVVQIVESPN